MARSQERWILYHYGLSYFSQRVRLALAEVGALGGSEVAFREVDIGPRMENYAPWYARINPGMVVPTLEIIGDGGPTRLTSSLAICRRIAERYPGAQLLPGEPAARARVEAWIADLDAVKIRELSYSRIPPPLGSLARRGIGLRSRRLQRIREGLTATEPALAAAYTARLADVVAWRETLGDPAALAAITGDVERLLRRLEEALAAGPYVAGEGYTLADLLATVLLGRLRFLGLTPWGLATSAWWIRMRERPSYAAAGIIDHLTGIQRLRLLGRLLGSVLRPRRRARSRSGEEPDSGHPR